jgi:hypothetical protein
MARPLRADNGQLRRSLDDIRNANSLRQSLACLIRELVSPSLIDAIH